MPKSEISTPDNAGPVLRAMLNTTAFSPMALVRFLAGTESEIIAARDGTYEIQLRRWPKEANAAIAAGVPPFKAVDGGLPAGKALPIARARLKLADVDETKPVAPDDRAVTFTVTLKAGTKLPLQTWFYDADGRELCGAYFADVRRK